MNLFLTRCSSLSLNGRVNDAVASEAGFSACFAGDWGRLRSGATPRGTRAVEHCMIRGRSRSVSPSPSIKVSSENLRGSFNPFLVTIRSCIALCFGCSMPFRASWQFRPNAAHTTVFSRNTGTHCHSSLVLGHKPLKSFQEAARLLGEQPHARTERCR